MCICVLLKTFTNILFQRYYTNTMIMNLLSTANHRYYAFHCELNIFVPVVRATVFNKFPMYLLKVAGNGRRGHGYRSILQFLTCILIQLQCITHYFVQDRKIIWSKSTTCFLLIPSSTCYITLGYSRCWLGLSIRHYVTYDMRKYLSVV